MTDDVRAAPAVIDEDPGRRGAFWLRLDGAAQSHVDPSDPGLLLFEYVARIGHVVDLVAPPGAPITALHLGGGAMSLPRYVAHSRPRSRQQVIESDPGVIAAVRERAPLPKNSGIRVRCADAADAATVLPGGLAGAVDLVVVDVFAGAEVPASVTTLGFFTSLRPLLAPDAVLAMNVADGTRLEFARSVARTIATALDADVMIVAEPAILKGRRFGNLVLIAGPLDAVDLARAVARDPFPATVLHGAEAVAFRAAGRVIHHAGDVVPPGPATTLRR